MLDLFKKLEAYISTARNVSNKHFERFVQTERQCWEKVEYLRHDTLEIAGVPSLVTLTFLRNEVKERDIKLCHRLIEKERTLIKFVNRKDVSHILRNKKKLKWLDTTIMGFPEGAKIFVNESLCSYYWDMWN